MGDDTWKILSFANALLQIGFLNDILVSVHNGTSLSHIPVFLVLSFYVSGIQLHLE